MYELQPDRDRYPIDSAGIYGDYDAALPGVVCNVCGEIWASSGHIYPQVDVEQLRRVGDFSSPWPVPLPKLLEKYELVRPFLPPGSPLAPGTRFGVIRGSLGKPADLSRLIGSYVLSRSAYERLAAAGVLLPPGYPANLVIKRTKIPADMLELAFLPTARWASVHLKDHPDLPCLACGRRFTKTPWDTIVVKSTIPSDLDIFRCYDNPNQVFVTERFKEAAEALKLTNMTFRQQQVIDE
jgi:uncharacterized double-CXXCG motif protein